MRIVVVGSSGSGKSTLAKALSRALDLPHTELDALNWQPGWRDLAKHEPDAFFRRVAEAAAGEAWVMDGNYTKSKDAHWPRATHFVWMDPPRSTVMRQVIWRSFARAVTKRELWPGSGNRELFRKWLEREHPIRWAWDNYALMRDRYAEWFEGGTYEGRPVHRVANAREASALIANLAAQKQSVHPGSAKRRPGPISTDASIWIAAASSCEAPPVGVYGSRSSATPKPG